MENTLLPTLLELLSAAEEAEHLITRQAYGDLSKILHVQKDLREAIQNARAQVQRTLTC
jgi:hypothetical protein